MQLYALRVQSRNLYIRDGDDSLNKSPTAIRTKNKVRKDDEVPRVFYGRY